MSFLSVLVGTPSQGTGPVTPAYPAGLAASNAIVCVISGKPTTANQTTSPTMPAGWTLIASNLDKGGSGATVGVDNGNLSLWIYRKDTVTGSESGTISITAGFVGVWEAVIFAVPSTNGVASIVAATAEDTTNGNLSLAFTSDPGVAASDLAIVVFAATTDGATFSAWVFSQSGISAWGAVAGLVDLGSTAANDSKLVAVSSVVTTGTSAGNPTVTATVGGVTVARGPGIFLRFREVSGITLTPVTNYAEPQPLTVVKTVTLTPVTNDTEPQPPTIERTIVVASVTSEDVPQPLTTERTIAVAPVASDTEPRPLTLERTIAVALVTTEDAPQQLTIERTIVVEPVTDHATTQNLQITQGGAFTFSPVSVVDVVQPLTIEKTIVIVPITDYSQIPPLFFGPSTAPEPVGGWVDTVSDSPIAAGNWADVQSPPVASGPWSLAA